MTTNPEVLRLAREQVKACPFCGRIARVWIGGPIFIRELWASCSGNNGEDHYRIALPLSQWNLRQSEKDNSDAD